MCMYVRTAGYGSDEGRLVCARVFVLCALRFRGNGSDAMERGMYGAARWADGDR